MPRAEAPTPARPHRDGDAAAGRTPRAGMRTEPQAPAGGARAGRHNILYGIGGPVPGHQNKMSGLGHHNFVVHRHGPFQRAGVFFVRTGVESVKPEGGRRAGKIGAAPGLNSGAFCPPTRKMVPPRTATANQSSAPRRGACPPRARGALLGVLRLRSAAGVGFQKGRLGNTFSVLLLWGGFGRRDLVCYILAQRRKK